MTSNWCATTSGLRYAGMDFLAYVEPEPVTQRFNGEDYYSRQIKWGAYFYNGDGAEERKETKKTYFASCAHAVQHVDDFFELDVEKQREQFRMMCNEA